MKPDRDKLMKFTGWILFLFVFGLFCLQLGYLFLHAKAQVEYIDNHLFYIINIFCMISLPLAIFLLLKLTKRFKLIGASIVGIFVILQVVLLVESNNKVNNITSISPDLKHVFTIKENISSGQAVYYRPYYGIFGRPKENLPHSIVGEYKVKWLANDIAVFTYKTAENTLQQFIGTYGDRKTGNSYYYVGAEIQGVWQGWDHFEVATSSEGITVTENYKKELFSWENIQQFGTLAIVLKKNNEARWTISLNENYVVHADASKPKEGNISLYKATMDKNQPVILQYETSN
jgi:hypothetical protein